ncbi:MAG: cadmium-translocating P-type ATPase, partial [Clostridia bacterium]|nr:cadmium-translocating P-type ATPase [Clostridia bacterium]
MKRKDKRTLVRIIIAIPLLVAAWICSELLPLDGILRLAAFLPAYIVIGSDVLYRAIRGCIGGQIFDENLLMALATIGAFATGEYPEAVAVMLFYQVGELFERIAVGRSRRSIAALMDICPDTATVEREGVGCEVTPDEVEVGEIILIRTGERVPLDGRVIAGSSSLDTAALTGESMPRPVTVGNEITAGCINREGLLRVRVSRPFAESTVTRILELVESAAERKAQTEQFITRFARWYTPCVVAAAALLAIIPPLFFSAPWQDWLHRAMVFLVISCPCALVISVPLSFFVGIGRASRRGILVKGGNYLEALADTDTLVMDKTGTLTQGSFSVREVRLADGCTEDLIALAAHAEAHSTHPIAQSLRDAYEKPPDPTRIGEVEELSGHGVRAVIDGRIVLVGNARLMEESSLSVPDVPAAGTAVHLAVDGNYAGCIIVADTVKPTAAHAIVALKRLGVTRQIMLTGDT